MCTPGMFELWGLFLILNFRALTLIIECLNEFRVYFAKKINTFDDICYSFFKFISYNHVNL